MLFHINTASAAQAASLSNGSATMCNQSGKLLALVLIIGVASCEGRTVQKDLPRPRLDGRIVGGQETSIDKIPFQVSLQRGYHFCGGSLIGKGLVLTAAHCTEGSATLLSKVRIGATRSDSGGVLVKIKKLHRHPKYSSATIDYDFAVLELAAYDEANVTQAYAQLPKLDEDLKDGTPLTVSGWGNTQSNAETSDVLRSVVVPKVSHAECLKAYGGFGDITERMLCAGLPEGGKDACQGDSGGPLASADGTLWGVVSWGYGCARPNYPGVYSRVAAVRDWIESVSGV
ncbi:trypsin 5G1 [Scaptodrosophila lebanonensis]|uniref:trypsin n=1 Tax=Drosophila lebanonensis TaxID=7225 RepID=A0A6J2TMM0_DROLE|nr:trypsin 5G1 [Scaptodrosophila lebanonensis]